MYKKLAFAIVGAAFLAAPLLVSAQTADTSNASLIAALTSLVQILEQELQQLIAAQGSSTVTGSNSTPASPQPSISSVNPQPAQVGSSLTVYFTNGGQNGSVILKTLDGSKEWSIPYTAGETADNGFAYYDGSKVTFTVPSTIGRGELPENSGYEAPVPITSGTYDLTVYATGCPQSGVCTGSPGTSNTFPITINASNSTQPSATTPSISQVAPQPVSVGASLTVNLSNGGNKGSIILETPDGSRFWSTGYGTSASEPSGFVVYNGSQLTFTVPSTIGGEGPNALSVIPITSGTYDVYVTSLVANANNIVTSTLGKSNVVPVQITSASQANPLSVSCAGSPYNSGTPGVSWGSSPSGGSGSYTYQWTLSNDIIATGISGTSADLQGQNLLATYGSTGLKSATVAVSDGNTTVTTSCSANVTASNSTQASATTPSISQVAPQPVSVGASLTVNLSNGGNKGSIILETPDGSRFWSTGYGTSASEPSGFVVYNGSQLTFTVPSTIGGEGPNALSVIPITSGTYDVYVTSLVANANNIVTSTLGKSNVVPVQITSASQANPLSVSCAGSPYNSGTPGVSWGSSPSGGSGSYTYQWTLSNDIIATGISGTSADLQGQNLLATYGSTGLKSATVAVSDGNTTVTTSCSANVTASNSTQASATTPSISQVAPQPVSVGASLTVNLSNGGNKGSIILETPDGSRFWSTGYGTSASEPSGFVVYNGSQLTFTVPSTIGGEGPNALSVIPITSGTYDVYVTSLVANANNIVTSTLGKSNVVPVQITSASQANPLSVSCAGSPYNSGTPGVSWGSSPSGGSGSYTYQWTLSNDIIATGISGTSADLQGQNLLATYGSTGLKSATVAVSDGNTTVTTSCSANVTASNSTQASATIGNASSQTASALNAIGSQLEGIIKTLEGMGQ